jgi:XRE family transcriptional regulator, aerobic/anaerobic benzoate catabolism transcriptional regulator
LPDDPHRFDDDQVFLSRLGEKLRTLRAQRGTTRRRLAEQADISDRYLSKLEGGTANPSIAVLRRIADVIDFPLEALVAGCQPGAPDPSSAIQMLSRLNAGQMTQAEGLIKGTLTGPAATDKARRISLIGLRGAGKSTLGRRLAEAESCPFIELNAVIEATYGAGIGELMAFSGQAGYRRYERRALMDVITEHEHIVIATGGGIATDAETFSILLERTHCVWLKASPEEHMERVIGQGDMRPMADNTEAMDDLSAILAAREPLYRKAELTVDTSARSEDQSYRDLHASVRLIEEFNSTET